jgi:putative alpha-1,2-mannosidase
LITIPYSLFGTPTGRLIRLYTIIEQDRTNDFINTFLAKYDEGGIMPMWDLAGNYTDCMIGYHAVPVSCRCLLKGH